MYSSSAENRTKKKGSQQPSFLGNKNPNVSMGSQQGVFSQKRECFAGGRTCNLANFTLLSKMITEERTEPEGLSILAENPSPLAEIPRQRDYAHDCLAEILQRIPSPAVRRPWQSQLSVVLGSPGRPSPLAVRGVRAPWQSGVSGAVLACPPNSRTTLSCPDRPPGKCPRFSVTWLL